MPDEAVSTKKDRASLSPEAKAARAAGQSQGRTVSRYLEALEESKLKQDRQRSPEKIQARTAELPGAIAAAKPLERVKLIQELMELENRLEELDKTVDISELENNFISIAAEYSNRKGVSYAAWLEVGVPATVLEAAGVTRGQLDDDQNIELAGESTTADDSMSRAVVERQFIPDVLADRYASAAMVEVWSPQGKVISERRLWVAVLEAQRDLGIETPESAIEAYKEVIDQVDLDSIRERERVVRHDVKARIEEFCALAGHEHIHKGMTSRDLTENIEQLQIRNSLVLVRDKLLAVAGALAQHARQHAELVMVGRSHNVPAQATTLGKRFATVGEELLISLSRLEELLDRYPLRGIKGPVGTQQDQLTLLDGDPAKVEELERRLAAHLGFTATLGSVGQVYPRSLDYDVVTALVQVSSPMANLARMIRLMAGYGLISEGFQAGQVGSSAMPGKRNARTSERICGFSAVVQGYADMVASLAGDQWNEGDVSCSVVRRVALPGAFLAVDGQIEATLTVLDELAVFKDAIAAELESCLPSLTATRVLMAAVAAGAGREDAHRIISEHVSRGHGFFDAVVGDDRIPLDGADVAKIQSQVLALAGAAPAHATRFADQVTDLSAGQSAASYQPESIL